jgi:hypothetical protein
MSSNIRFFLLLPLLFARLQAQTNEVRPTIEQVLKRLDALESENRRLADELHALRQELAAAEPALTLPPAPPLEERVEVNEKRVAEQAQTKVESSQKFPLSLNGMLLFNAFSSSAAASSLYTGYPPLLDGPSRTGATLGQSIVGLQFQGPSLPGQGRVNGYLSMDFWGDRSASDNTGWLRIREADLSLDWKKRTLSFGQMRPLLSPLQPTSLAEVAVSPLAGAGNLWNWLPQARYEERLALNSKNGVNLQAALIQTDESAAIVEPQYVSSLQRARPALEGRAAFWHKVDEGRPFEIGASFHASSTRVAGAAIPSHIASVDWSISPLAKLQWTGTVYKGQNVASLGSLGNGFTIYRDGSVHAIQTTAGWTQVAVPITDRLTFHLFGGLESDAGSYGVLRNFTYASNIAYRLGPNVVIAVEALQSRYRYYSGGSPIVNHYDLALAYLF